MFARHEASPALQRGQVVKGRVIQITAEHVFVDVGGKGEAWIERAELSDDEGRLRVTVGDEVEATVVSTGDEVRLSHKLRQGAQAREALGVAAQSGMPVEGKVAAVISRRTAWRSIACSSCARICRCGRMSRRCVRARAKWRWPGCRAPVRAPCAACSWRPSRAGRSACFIAASEFASEASPAMLRVLLEPRVDAGKHGARLSLLKSRGGSREPDRSHMGRRRGVSGRVSCDSAPEN